MFNYSPILAGLEISLFIGYVTLILTFNIWWTEKYIKNESLQDPLYMTSSFMAIALPIGAAVSIGMLHTGAK